MAHCDADGCRSHPPHLQSRHWRNPALRRRDSKGFHRGLSRKIASISTDYEQPVIECMDQIKQIGDAQQISAAVKTSGVNTHLRSPIWLSVRSAQLRV